MNKKLYLLFALLIFTTLLFTNSCESNDDEEKKVSDEWINYQRKIFTDVANLEDESGNKLFKSLKSDSGDGSLYYRVTDSIKSVSQRITKLGYPYVNDTVICRYKGWYFNIEGKRIVFDTTEGENSFNEINFTVNSVIDGWSTILQEMREGDEREICVPHQLGYGTSSNGSGTTAIPGYSTLWFTIKVVKINPVNRKEAEQWKEDELNS